MATVSLPETVENFHTLTRLSAREDCFDFCRRESFKTWTCIIFTEDCNVLPVSYSSRSFLQPCVALFLLLRNIPFSTPYTNTLNFCTSIYRISTWNEETLMLSFLLWLLWLLVTLLLLLLLLLVKVKVIPQQANVPQGVPGGLRPRIFLTFGTTRAVGHQPYVPAAFTPGEIPGTHFQRLSRPQGTWFRREPRKKFPVTPSGIDPGTSSSALTTTLPQAPIIIIIIIQIYTVPMEQKTVSAVNLNFS
jgi:hypothetical protein